MTRVVQAHRSCRLSHCRRLLSSPTVNMAPWIAPQIRRIFCYKAQRPNNVKVLHYGHINVWAEFRCQQEIRTLGPASPIREFVWKFLQTTQTSAALPGAYPGIPSEERDLEDGLWAGRRAEISDYYLELFRYRKVTFRNDSEYWVFGSRWNEEKL